MPRDSKVRISLVVEGEQGTVSRALYRGELADLLSAAGRRVTEAHAAGYAREVRWWVNIEEKLANVLAIYDRANGGIR